MSAHYCATVLMDDRGPAQVNAYTHGMAEALMTEQELAEYCRVATSTVRRWRAEGTGPPVVWAGTRPRYRRSEVDAWLVRKGTQG